MSKKVKTVEEHYKLLNSVVSKLKYIPTKLMIIKPLPDEYVDKEIVKPVDTGKTDENGYKITDSETVIEKTLTTYRKGVVLSLPTGYQWQNPNEHPEVGDIVAYNRRHALDFDLFKDSQLVDPYNVVAYIKGEEYYLD